MCMCVITNCSTIGGVSQSMLLVTMVIAVNAKYMCVIIYFAIESKSEVRIEMCD
jgi:hypothetical protein